MRFMSCDLERGYRVGKAKVSLKTFPDLSPRTVRQTGYAALGGSDRTELDDVERDGRGGGDFS